MSMNQVASDLYKALTESDERKPKPYDVKATVLREEGNIVWVKIPGGVDETPVQKTNNANAGDDVMVRISGGRAWLLGNETSPATDDTVANAATQLAEGAGNLAKTAADSAIEAQQNAQIAYRYADEAHDAAEEAVADARTAFDAANNAQVQLSVIEDVAGTLSWIQEHGSYELTTDTTVQEGTVYFIYNSSTHDYEPIASPDPTKNPQQEGWYILDINDSQSDYIMSHIAVTSRGLWVLPSGMGTATDAQYAPNYKVLLASDGLYVYDGSGVLVSTFGENVIFSSTRDQKIGGTNNYIQFDSETGAISIVGANITFGSNKNLNDVLTDIDVSVIQTSTGADITVNGDTVSIENGQDGSPGQRGGLILKTTTAPTSYTTTIGGFTPSYRILLSTVKTQSGASDVIVGDVIEYSYYHYPIGYVDSTYAYTAARTSIRGATGAANYVWIRYSANSDGSNMVATPTSATKYIGVYRGTSSSAPTTASSYTWSKYVGDDGESGEMLYATSDSLSTVTNKVATLSSGTLNLEAGVLVAVTFAHGNDYEVVTAPTLNIDSTGAVVIKASNGASPSNVELSWTDGACILFLYDGTYWRFADSGAFYGLSSLTEQVETTVGGPVFYQYTTGGVTYDVWYDENDEKYYYYNGNGVKTEVAYANLDRDDGDVISFRKGGLADRASQAESNISSLTETTGAQSNAISTLQTQADGNAMNIASQAQDIARLQTGQNDINTRITATNTNIVNLGDRITTLERGVVIDPVEPSVSVVSQSGAVKVTDGKVTIKGAGNTVSWADSESFNAKRLVSSDIRPRYMRFDGDNVTLAGSYTILGRSNGHLSVVKTLA